MGRLPRLCSTIRNSAAAATTTKAPARTTSTRLANTGGQLAVLVAAGLLAFVAGELILCATRRRAGSTV